MNYYPLLISLKKGYKVLTFQNKNLNPLLYMYLGTILIESIALSYNTFLQSNDLSYEKIVYTSLSFASFCLCLAVSYGVEIEIVKSIIRQYQPSFNILKLIFRRITLRYLGVSFLYSSILFFIVFILCLSLFFILDNITVKDYLSNPIQNENFTYKISSIFVIFSSIFITPIVYIFIQIIDNKPLSLKESVQKTKGHFIHIGSMNFLHSIFYCGLIFFRGQDLFSKSLGVECGIDMILTSMNLLFIVTLSYYIRDYVEKTPVKNELK